MPAGENTEKLKNMRKLKRLLKLVPVDRRAVAEKLIAEIAFMEDTLNGLRRHIEKNGAIDISNRDSRNLTGKARQSRPITP